MILFRVWLARFLLIAFFFLVVVMKFGFLFLLWPLAGLCTFVILFGVPKFKRLNHAYTTVLAVLMGMGPIGLFALSSRSTHK